VCCVCSVGVEGGLSRGGDETAPLLVLWGDWLVLRRSSSLKPEFCLKKPGLGVYGEKKILFHSHLEKLLGSILLGLCCKNLGCIGTRRGGQRLLGALTLQLDVLIRVLLGRVCRETKDGNDSHVFTGISQGSNNMAILICYG